MLGTMRTQLHLRGHKLVMARFHLLMSRGIRTLKCCKAGLFNESMRSRSVIIIGCNRQPAIAHIMTQRSATPLAPRSLSALAITFAPASMGTADRHASRV